MSANPLLSIEGLTASVDEKTILHNVNLNVAAGETHVLMGPNGAGKSTLGHLVMGDPVARRPVPELPGPCRDPRRATVELFARQYRRPPRPGDEGQGIPSSRQGARGRA